MTEVSELAGLLHVFLQERHGYGAQLDLVYSDGTMSLSGTDERLGIEQGFTRIAAARSKSKDHLLAEDEYDPEAGRWFSVKGAAEPTLEDILAYPGGLQEWQAQSAEDHQKVVAILAR